MILTMIMHHHKLSKALNIPTPKKKVKMEWKTNKDKQINKTVTENVYKNTPGTRRTAKSVKTNLHCSNFCSGIK